MKSERTWPRNEDEQRVMVVFNIWFVCTMTVFLLQVRGDCRMVDIASSGPFFLTFDYFYGNFLGSVNSIPVGMVNFLYLIQVARTNFNTTTFHL